MRKVAEEKINPNHNYQKGGPSFEGIVNLKEIYKILIFIGINFQTFSFSLEDIISKNVKNQGFKQLLIDLLGTYSNLFRTNACAPSQ